MTRQLRVNLKCLICPWQAPVLPTSAWQHRSKVPGENDMCNNVPGAQMQHEVSSVWECHSRPPAAWVHESSFKSQRLSYFLQDQPRRHRGVKRDDAPLIRNIVNWKTTRTPKTFVFVLSWSTTHELVSHRKHRNNSGIKQKLQRGKGHGVFSYTSITMYFLVVSVHLGDIDWNLWGKRLPYMFFSCFFFYV